MYSLGYSSNVRPPKQDRSRATLERIARAALDILAQDGVDALTVQAIVVRANSSVGSFYSRFQGKDDLVEYLGARVWDEALDRWNEALESHDWADLELAELAQGAIGLLIDADRSRALYLRAIDQASGSDGGAYAAFREHVLHGVGALLLLRVQEIDHLQPELAVRLGLRAVLGMIAADAREDAEPLSRATLIGEARALLLGYLSPVGPAAAKGEVDFFDIWD